MKTKGYFVSKRREKQGLPMRLGKGCGVAATFQNSGDIIPFNGIGLRNRIVLESLILPR
jgi:hypothetical protein